ncbi:cytochrome c oxidase subunit 3 [Roseospira goensis]|uniref:cytochrome-c oxidase n=1 Tax=Roseospira goensis TaxID=391922 RepID=A0A7W6WM62_9PROT|nr:cytochrome c oxidase subunit 3 [Roseospira goensis]MBB4287177.1 heme/copper-type cytochrome/quinol oxidase subunit 3 [Roseospira goensis]
MSSPESSSAGHAPGHPFHLVNPSPWPVLGAIGAFVMAYGGVEVMHDGPPWILLAGLAVVVLTMALWWRDVVRESRAGGHHTRPVRFGLRTGMGLFIASEVMFFVAFFWAYFHNAFLFSPVVERWPPGDMAVFDPWGLPLINTVVLVTSGGVLMWGRGGLDTGDRRRLVLGLAGAALLGAAFLVLQVIEYAHAAFAFTDGIYPSVFFMATGFHGFHVFVGVCFLLVCLVRARAGHFSAEKHLGLQAAEWYWHFVDVVWLFLFGWFYVYVAL